MSHSFKIRFAQDVRHRRRGYNGRFNLKERVIAFLIITTEIKVMFVVMMKKRRFTAGRASGVFADTLSFLMSGSKLMFTNTALIFLITELILAIFI